MSLCVYTEGVTVDLEHTTGYERFIAELFVRKYRGFNTIPRSFFRRACKRCGISQRETRDALVRDKITLTRCLPSHANLPSFEFRSFDEWYALGYVVRKGEGSYAKRWTGERDIPMFDRAQVIPRKQ
ncbi:hypothetical protein HOU79_gp36 [Vibrio phage 1.224.A._10N.261.48.B1]|uniref:Uncharacterized protein n=1 Tax=Vibrio phage 1.224.A._10N.261.48.B1 TaxID=1881226 RepID=A0A2I7RS20_9CAUD|nr:hypothetical protein HOU79_gp36 [Vibrio phage 1.224.A._10N.261.48.B1]AUR96437.1 hypothetical protein NVP1224A_70 [Vibrio phage 1.224.A._10N.261.48.B1]